MRSVICFGLVQEQSQSVLGQKGTGPLCLSKVVRGVGGEFVLASSLR
jgi:hypothetical protein